MNFASRGDNLNSGDTVKIQYHSEVGRIDSLILKRPEEAFIDQQHVLHQWQQLNYLECPDYKKAIKEYEAFLELLQESVPDIQYLPQNPDTGLDSIYIRDAILMTDRGAVVLNMGKVQRNLEPKAAVDFLASKNFPVLGTITGSGKMEGGDVVFLDEKTVAVGLGYRTNAEGIQQLKRLTQDFISEIMTVPLPHWHGPDDVMHLMSVLSPIDKDLALVFSPLLPVFFRQWLLEQGIKLIEVPDEEYLTMACNVLAVAPRDCIMLSGNPETRRRMEAQGVRVREYKGDEISRKGAGGPTCLTRPIIRQD